MSANLSFCQAERVHVQASIQYSGGGPFNITGYTITWVLSLKRGTTPIITKSTTAATITILSGVNGSIEWYITSAETRALAAGTYHHECNIKSPAGRQFCAWHGTANVGATSIGIM